jgi:tetratricopeptide (TPR) repeat protein
VSADADALRDRVELLMRSLDDARGEHARGDLDDASLDAIERRDGARLAAARAELATLEPDVLAETRPPARGASPRPRWLLGVAVASLAVAVGIVAIAATDPFARATRLHLPSTRQAKVASLVIAAEVLVTQRHWLRALTAYDAVLRLAPRNAEALVESGWLRYEYPGLGGHDPHEVALGVIELHRAERLAPNDAAAHLYWGIVLYQHFHDPRGARAELLRAASLHESPGDARLAMALIYALSS